MAQARAIRLDSFEAQVRIGCTSDERQRPQRVHISVEIRLARAPAGEATDELSGTIDYGEIAARIREVAESDEFNLIERLACDCLAAIRALTSADDQVAVQVRKMQPPIAGLLGGASYVCGDFLIP